MGVSKNSGTPKSSILIGFSIINHPFWGTPIFGNTHIDTRWGGFIQLFFSIFLRNLGCGNSIPNLTCTSFSFMGGRLPTNCLLLSPLLYRLEVSVRSEGPLLKNIVFPSAFFLVVRSYLCVCFFWTTFFMYWYVHFLGSMMPKWYICSAILKFKIRSRNMFLVQLLSSFAALQTEWGKWHVCPSSVSTNTSQHKTVPFGFWEVPYFMTMWCNTPLGWAKTGLLCRIGCFQK